MLFWASSTSVLGWIYVLLASFWLHLFQRDAIRHYERVPSGYRIGAWKVYWHLPTRAAIVITLLSCAPLLAVIFLEGWPVTLILVFMTILTVFLWIISPPGHEIGFAARGLDTGSPKLIPNARYLLQVSILRLVILGLVPALTIGALLSRTIIRIAG